MDKLFDNLYNKFLLRDLLGKVLPGLILILGFTYAYWPKGLCLIFPNKPENLFYYLVIYGLSFIVGLVLQFINPVRLFPFLRRLILEEPTQPLDRLYEFLNRRTRFNRGRNPQASLLVAQIVIDQRERLVVLKDVTGKFRGCCLYTSYCFWELLSYFYFSSSLWFEFVPR